MNQECIIYMIYIFRLYSYAHLTENDTNKEAEDEQNTGNDPIQPSVTECTARRRTAHKTKGRRKCIHTTTASVLPASSYLTFLLLHFTQLCSTRTTYYIFNKDRFAICTIYTSCLVSTAIPLLLYSYIISVFTNVYSILYYV